MKLAGDEDVRCARCGRWPDQDTAVGGDWLWFAFDDDGNPVRRLCPGCHERVMHAIERSADWRPLDEIIIEIAQRWPERGRPHDSAALASSIDDAARDLAEHGPVRKAELGTMLTELEPEWQQMGHRYTACGLDSVHLHGGVSFVDTAYGRGYSIEQADDLGRLIAATIVLEQGAFTGQEVRFLRGLLDLSAGELGTLVGADGGSVLAWEHDAEATILREADLALRKACMIQLDLEGEPRIAEHRIGGLAFRFSGAWERC